MLDKQTVHDDRVKSVSIALQEDTGHGDITAELVPEDRTYKAQVISREPATVCGVDWVNETFRQVDESLQLTWYVGDGDTVEADQSLFLVEGSARAILTAERTALNFLQLLSATATVAARYAKAVKGTAVDGVDTRILDTRKTIPGLRTAQKYAVQCGGCYNHRIGLYDAFLIKENHIAACGSIEAAIIAARNNHPGKSVEIEVESMTELKRALDASADIVMLDNFSIDELTQAVQLNKDHHNRAKLEASGNMSVESLRTVAKTGVDYISSGALTKHIQAIDLSMRFID